MGTNNISVIVVSGGICCCYGGVAGLAATGCSAESSLETTEETGLPVDPAKGGEWIPCGVLA